MPIFTMPEDNFDELNLDKQAVRHLILKHRRHVQRLETLESRDGEMWRKVVGHVVTFTVGAVLAFLFAQVGM